MKRSGMPKEYAKRLGKEATGIIRKVLEAKRLPE